MIDENTILSIQYKSDGTIYDECGNNVQNIGSVPIETSNNVEGMHFTSGKYLIVTTNGKFNLTGDFTIEFWLKCEQKNYRWPAIFCTQNTWSDDTTCCLVCTQDWKNQIGITQKTLGDCCLVPYDYEKIAKYWNHVAIVCKDSKYTIYYNGKITTNPTRNHYTNGLDLNINGKLYIGVKGTETSNPLNGYLKDFKISTVARYDGNFEIERTIGDNLSTPDYKFQRIDETNELIDYTGVWTDDTSIGNYNGKCKYVTYGNYGKSIFRIFSSKIRIIAACNMDHSNNYQMKIDDELYTFSSYKELVNRCILIFQKINLDNKEHIIEIYNIDNKVINIDAIDIDDTGRMLTADEFDMYRNRKKIIKTNDEYILNDGNYPLTSNLLDFKNNYDKLFFEMTDINNKIKTIDKDYKIVNIK